MSDRHLYLRDIVIDISVGGNADDIGPALRSAIAEVAAQLPIDGNGDRLEWRVRDAIAGALARRLRSSSWQH